MGGGAEEHGRQGDIFDADYGTARQQDHRTTGPRDHSESEGARRREPSAWRRARSVAGSRQLKRQLGNRAIPRDAGQLGQKSGESRSGSPDSNDSGQLALRQAQGRQRAACSSQRVGPNRAYARWLTVLRGGRERSPTRTFVLGGGRNPGLYSRNIEARVARSPHEGADEPSVELSMRADWREA